MGTPFKMKAGKEGPMKKNFGISPMKQDILGPASKRNIEKLKNVVNKVKTFVKGFSREEIDKSRNQRYRDYVKKSNKNPKKYPPKSSDEVY